MQAEWSRQGMSTPSKCKTTDIHIIAFRVLKDDLSCSVALYVE